MGCSFLNNKHTHRHTHTWGFLEETGVFGSCLILLSCWEKSGPGESRCRDTERDRGPSRDFPSNPGGETTSTRSLQTRDLLNIQPLKIFGRKWPKGAAFFNHQNTTAETGRCDGASKNCDGKTAVRSIQISDCSSAGEQTSLFWSCCVLQQ